MSDNLQTIAPVLTKNTSANLSLDNPILINLNQFSYDLAEGLQQKNNGQHSIYIDRDKSEIDNIEKMFQPVFIKLGEKESSLTTKELLLAIAACLKKQTIEGQSLINEQNLGVAEFRDEAESLHNRKINFTGNEREEKNSGVFFIDQWPLAIGHCPYTPLFFIHCVTSTFSN